MFVQQKSQECVQKKLGVAVSGVCADICSHDGDCPNDEKCCSNGCGHQCTDLSIGMLYKCTGHIFPHYSD